MYDDIKDNKCNLCQNKIGDPFINQYGKLEKTKLLHTHHIIYIIIFPWYGTITLCASCHGKLTYAERKKKKKSISLDNV